MCKTGNVLLLFKWQTLMETPRFPETQEAGGEVNPQEPNHIFLQANTYYRPRTAALCGLRIGSNLKTSWARSCSFEWLLMLTILAVCFENFSELKVQDLKTCNCCCKSADAACLTGLRLAFFWGFLLIDELHLNTSISLHKDPITMKLRFWFDGTGLASLKVSDCFQISWKVFALEVGMWRLQQCPPGESEDHWLSGETSKHFWATCQWMPRASSQGKAPGILSHPVTSCVSCWICWISYTSTELEFQWNLLVVDILYLSQNDLCKTKFQYDATKNIHT